MKGTKLAGWVCGFGKPRPKAHQLQAVSRDFQSSGSDTPTTPQYAAWLVVLYQPGRTEFHLCPHAADAAAGIIPIEKARGRRASDRASQGLTG
jgi:hypothetical protein